MARRHRSTPPRRALARSGIALLALAGCSDLQPIEANQCGNRVVEPDVNEECDGQEHCGDPGASSECRYLCDEVECPAGFGCGLDKVCRRPSGVFESIFASSTVTTSDVLAGDINADGCVEMVRTTLRGNEITAFASRVPGACTASEQTLQIRRPEGEQEPRPAPLLADLIDSGGKELVTAGDGLLGAGLFIYFADATPTLSPLLYPIVNRREASVRTLTVRLQGADALLIIGQQGQQQAGPAGVALLVDPAKKPLILVGDFPGGDSIVALAAGDLDPDPAMPEGACDEVALAHRGEPTLQLYRLCAGGTPTFSPLPSPEVALTGGVRVRDDNAVLALVDHDGDGRADLLTSTDTGAVHIAHGLGDGTFHSSPPPAASPDQATSVLQGVSVDPHSIFAAGDFDAATPGAEIMPIACPEATPFGSPVCMQIDGPCEAIVADIDADGRPDVVSVEEQQPDVIVHRNIAGGSFHTSFLETQCPPHHLAAGDFDGDGVTDVAFFDQVSPAMGVTATTLKISYGNALAAPTSPREQGRFEQAIDLSAGQFGAGVSGAQLYATRQLGPMGQTESAVALIAGSSERSTLAPLYFLDNAMSSMESTIPVELRATAAGRFTTASPGEPRSSIAVIAREEGAERLWIIAGDGSASSLRATRPEGVELPGCGDCVLVAVPTRPDAGDEVLMLGDGVSAVLAVTEGGSTDLHCPALTHDFRSIDTSNPPKYVPRPLVADLDGDGLEDVVARAKTGELVGLWGRADGCFDETVLVEAPECPPGSDCGRLSLARLNVDGDAAMELVVVGLDYFNFYDVDPAARELVPADAEPPIRMLPPSTDFTAVVAADVDGDGVDDLVTMLTSTFVDVFRGIPVVE